MKCLNIPGRTGVRPFFRRMIQKVALRAQAGKILAWRHWRCAALPGFQDRLSEPLEFPPVDRG